MHSNMQHLTRAAAHVPIWQGDGPCGIHLALGTAVGQHQAGQRADGDLHTVQGHAVKHDLEELVGAGGHARGEEGGLQRQGQSEKGSVSICPFSINKLHWSYFCVRAYACVSCC